MGRHRPRAIRTGAFLRIRQLIQLTHDQEFAVLTIRRSSACNALSF